MLSAEQPGSKKDLLVARFWLNVAQDAKIRARLQAENLPVKLYNLLKEKDAERSKTSLTRTSSEQPELEALNRLVV